MERFKQPENDAREKYFEKLVRLLNSSKSQMFWNITDKGRKNTTKTIVQPIKFQDGAYAKKILN